MNETTTFYYDLWIRACALAHKAVIYGNASDARHFAHSAVSNWRKWEQSHLAEQRQKALQRFERQRLETVAWNEELKYQLGRPVPAA